MDQFIGEIRIWTANPGRGAPSGWLLCNGLTYSISQYPTLFQLIGTTYGGDGQATFGVPDLRSRIPLSAGTSSFSGTTYQTGQNSGLEAVTLNTQNLPAHNHNFVASTNGVNQASPGNAVLGAQNQAAIYSNFTPATGLSSATIGSVGGGGSHPNIMPFLALNYIIAFEGVYPTQS